MKTFLAITLISSFVILFSCTGDDDDDDNNVVTYPFTMTYNSFSEGGITTYVKAGKIATPAYLINDKYFEVLDEEFAKFIQVKSATDATFIYCDKNDLATCLADTTAEIMETNIMERNDSIIFKNLHPLYSAFFPELPSKGEINVELSFPRTTYHYTNTTVSGGSTSVTSITETVFGISDFTTMINDLGEGDTLSFINYHGIYKK